MIVVAPLEGSSGAAGEWWFGVTHPCILCSFGVPAPLKGSLKNFREVYD